MFFTITFRPFTPQPGGLEFLPGNDYYFISTSSKDDLYRRIGGRCSTNNMKVVFKVCCAPEDKNNRTNSNMGGNNGSGGGIGNNGGNTGSGNSGSSNSNTVVQQQHSNNINVNSQLPLPKLPGMGGGGGINTNGGLMINGNSGTSINTNIDQFNRIPMQQPNNVGGGSGNIGMNGIGINNAGNNGQHPTGIRINNVPSSQQHPSQKNGMHGGFIVPMSNINTNSSNVVQSTINWPNWASQNNNNNNNHNGNQGGSDQGSVNIEQHSTPVSTIGIYPHLYPSSHKTSQDPPNENSAIFISSNNYSPSHKPTKKTNDYDKHPNEVVKNEELTYNSAASSLYKMRRRKGEETIESAPLAPSKSQGFKKSTYKSISIYQRFKSFLQLLLFTSNHRNRINTINTVIHFVSNYNPIILTTTVLVILINLFQYKLSSWSMQLYNLSKVPPSTTTNTTKRTRTSSQQLLTPKLASSPPKILISPVDCILMDDEASR